MTLKEKHNANMEFIFKLRTYCDNHICKQSATSNIPKCDLSICKCECRTEEICFDNFKKIMEYEPPVDWSKVPVDTKIYVRDSKFGRWVPRHFAKYKNDKVYAFENGCTSFSGVNNSLTTWKYAKLAEGEDDK